MRKVHTNAWKPIAFHVERRVSRMMLSGLPAMSIMPGSSRKVMRERGASSQAAHLSANVAQLVEQLTRNEQVTGSSPVVGSISKDPVGSS